MSQLPAIFFEDDMMLKRKIASGYSMACGDINGDFRDDIVHADLDSIYFSVQLNDGDYYEVWDAFEINSAFLSCNLADLNEDGINEVLVSGNRNGLQVYSFNRSTNHFELIADIETDHYAQGSSVVDVDGDLDLDFFIANDVGYNRVYINSSGDSLELLGDSTFDVLPTSGSSGNYNAIWFDPDLDGDMDLYITKCHVNANSFTDPRRINQFFRNDDNIFIEMAEDFGLAHGDQSWCSIAEDFDNDGDADIMLLNHGTAFMLLENNFPDAFTTHNSFVDGKELLGDEQQLVSGDFNNDGWIDVAVFGFQDQMLINQGGLRFTAYPFFTGTLNAYSGVSGDFNNDGWLDLYTSYGVGGSAIEDKLYTNFSMSNHWVKFSLNGINSNRQAVGTRVEVFADNQKFVRWVDSGESYGISNSLSVHFGLNDFTTIDSVHFYWPSGHVDAYYTLDADKHYVITEDKCLTELSHLISDSEEFNCDHLSINLNTSEDFPLLWNTGESSKDIVIDHPGYYWAFTEDNSDHCFNATQWQYFRPEPEAVRPQINESEDILLCPADSYTLSTRGLELTEWNTGAYSSELTVSEPGIYFAFDTQQCDTLSSDTIVVDFVDLPLTDIEVVINSQGDLILETGVEQTVWYSKTGEELGEGATLLVEKIVSDTSFYFEASLDPICPIVDYGPFADETQLQSISIDSALAFEMEVNELMEFVGFSCFANESVGYLLKIHTADDEIFLSREVQLEVGWNRIDIEANLNPGIYSLSMEKTVTSGQNMHNLQGYKLGEEKAFIVSGHALKLNYLETASKDIFAFNIEIRPVCEKCTSGRLEYFVQLDTLVNTHELKPENLNIYPNPTRSITTLEMHSAFDFSIINLTGQIVYTTNKESKVHMYDFTLHDAGAYIIQFRQDGKLGYKKIMVTK